MVAAEVITCGLKFMYHILMHVFIYHMFVHISHELNLPSDATKTSPKPIPSGAPQFRNFSLGAHTAIVERPINKLTN